jgi:putative ABC transport system ATP-binding protein
MEVARGEFVAIMGPSGSGKTTLLNCASTIERATSGMISIGGRDVSAMRGRELARFRRDQLGFIFQDFNLLDTLTARDNISLALTIKGASPSQIKGKVDAVAAELGVLDVLNKYPSQMSGGQKQRVAAARAIVADPELILADEPTGALDSKSSRALLDALTMMNTQLGATIMMVTHDAFAASFASRVIFLRDGRIFNEVLRGNDSREDLFARIMDVVTYLAQAE